MVSLWGAMLASLVPASRLHIRQAALLRCSPASFSSMPSSSSSSSYFSSSSSSSSFDSAPGPSTPQVFVPSGLLAVYKPQNWTSSDVVGKVKWVLQRGAQSRAGGRKCRIKVGHGGTLDPLAQGVLVLGVGEGTKLMSEFLSGSKEYVGTGLLGSETDTQDCTGTVTETVAWSPHTTPESLGAALSAFRGDIMQTPPMYSALKRDGKKLYELARAGVEVEREQRPVSILRLELVDRSPAQLGGQPLSLPDFGLSVRCGGGTYVRTLMSDIARSCGTRAHMTGLLRCQQGPFTLDDCLYEENWTFENIVAALEASAEKTGRPVPSKSAVIWPN